MHGHYAPEVLPGEYASFSLQVGTAHAPHMDNAPFLKNRKVVISDANNNPARTVQSFIGQIMILDYPGHIKVGFNAIIDCHVNTTGCRISKILAKIDKKTGEVIKKNPEYIGAYDGALVEIEPYAPMVVEEYSFIAAMGRFVIRDWRQTVGGGIVKKV